jgi:hypothetical protein
MRRVSELLKSVSHYNIQLQIFFYFLVLCELLLSPLSHIEECDDGFIRNLSYRTHANVFNYKCDTHAQAIV